MKSFVCFRGDLPIGIGVDERQCWLSAEAYVRRMHLEQIAVYGKAWPTEDRRWQERQRLLASNGYQIREATLEEVWTPVSKRLPDDDLTVMVAPLESDEEVWLGYHDADGWHFADAAPAQVTHWKPMPDGPKP